MDIKDKFVQMCKMIYKSSEFKLQIGRILRTMMIIQYLKIK